MAFRAISSNATPAHPLVVSAAPLGTIADGEILIAWAIIDDQNAHTFTLTGFSPLASFPLALNNGGGTDGGGMWVGIKKAASESGNYSISNSGGNQMNGGIACFSGRDATNYLHRSSIGTNNTANASPWTMTTAAFGAGNTADTCDIVFIGWSDNKTSGTVTHAEPSGHTKRADVNSGFFQSFLSSQDGVAAGATGVLSAIGTQVGQQAGWACACIALLAAAGGGGGTGKPDHYYRMLRAA